MFVFEILSMKWSNQFHDFFLNPTTSIEIGNHDLFYFSYVYVCVYVIDSMPYMIHQISWFIRGHDFSNEFPMIELGFKKNHG
jgi:hypothetical protein